MVQDQLLLPCRSIWSHPGWLLSNRHCHPLSLYVRQADHCFHPYSMQVKPVESFDLPQWIRDQLSQPQGNFLHSLRSSGCCQQCLNQRSHYPHLNHLSHSNPLTFRIIHRIWSQHQGYFSPLRCLRQIYRNQILPTCCYSWPNHSPHVLWYQQFHCQQHRSFIRTFHFNERSGIYGQLSF